MVTCFFGRMVDCETLEQQCCMKAQSCACRELTGRVINFIVTRHHSWYKHRYAHSYVRYCGTDWRIYLVSHSTQQRLIPKGEYLESVCITSTGSAFECCGCNLSSPSNRVLCGEHFRKRVAMPNSVDGRLRGDMFGRILPEIHEPITDVVVSAKIGRSTIVVERLERPACLVEWVALFCDAREQRRFRRRVCGPDVAGSGDSLAESRHVQLWFFLHCTFT